jgi:hypothetical protein
MSRVCHFYSVIDLIRVTQYSLASSARSLDLDPVEAGEALCTVRNLQIPIPIPWAIDGARLIASAEVFVSSSLSLGPSLACRR